MEEIYALDKQGFLIESKNLSQDATEHLLFCIEGTLKELQYVNPAVHKQLQERVVADTITYTNYAESIGDMVRIEKAYLNAVNILDNLIHTVGENEQNEIIALKHEYLARAKELQ